MLQQEKEDKRETTKYFVIALVIFAIVLSVLSMVAQWQNRPFNPLENIQLEFVSDTTEPLDTTEMVIRGCVKEDVTAFLYSFWVSDEDNFSVLGPSTATTVESGCIDTVVQVQVPPVEPGSWHLAMIVVVNNDKGRYRTISITTDSIEIR